MKSGGLKFTIDQILILVALIGLWFAAIVRGNILGGTLGAVACGAISAGALFLVVNLLINWKKRSIYSRIGILVFASLVAYTVAFPWHVWPQYFQPPLTSQRVADNLQYSLWHDPRYRRIVVTLDKGPRNVTTVKVKGSVDSAEDESELYRMVENADDWEIEWEVIVREK